ncbi:2-phospho-L-lactate transferase [Roseomonas sp. NAR14]|uniref:2-phospho-L-lactate transferase n=1 Tax=Roseomonas acroporae TaxID=2937791 RepID=A0A9X1Y9Q0_9PROT|nr:2-phospho-L-lactate transferase [Roseomonas acroporae]MCK8785680.1 2-phospho-L-lactate transferase [Roseomonas acroporae]
MSGTVLALSGGIGGAKLALGLAQIIPGEALTVLANTGDDFEHLGLAISPDIDTLTYALAGLDNPITGWGRRDESWSFMTALRELGGEDWFQLGDRDLATHVERTRRLRAGETLSAVTEDFRRRLGIGARLLPMSDQPVRTKVLTPEGWLDFQHWFVRLRCAPAVRGLEFAGAESARPLPAILDALRDPALRAVVICPSNPLISIDPILAVPGLRHVLRECRAPVVAVSPIIGGRAVKGPTATMLADLGTPPAADAVARHYGDLLDGYVLDAADAALAPGIAARCAVAPTLMTDLASKAALARVVLDLADRIAAERRA